MKSYWDHAFASGAALEQPKHPNPIADWVFTLLEQEYSKYCVRKLWRAWQANSILASGVRLGGNARLINRNQREAVRLGQDVVCRGIIRAEKTGEVLVGDRVYIGDDVIISAAERVILGEGTLLAHGVQIFDNTSHPIAWHEREQHYKMLLGQVPKQEVNIPSAAIEIGKYCWIGTSSIILKGVTIGDRSVVGAGCVVTSDVPPDTLVAGAGQRTLRTLADSENTSR